MIEDTVSEQEALWIEAVRKGDDLAFGWLVESCQKPVLSLCDRMLGNSNEAEDAAQEAFIRADRHLYTFKNRICINAYRRVFGTSAGCCHPGRIAYSYRTKVH